MTQPVSGQGSVKIKGGTDGWSIKIGDVAGAVSAVASIGGGIVTGASLVVAGGIGLATYTVGKVCDRYYTGISKVAMDRVEAGFSELQPGAERSRRLASEIHTDLTATTSLLDRQPDLLNPDMGARFDQRARDLRTIQKKGEAVQRNLEELVPLHRNQMTMARELHTEMDNNREVIKNKFMGGLFS